MSVIFKHEYSAGAILYTIIEERYYFVLVQETDGHIGFPKGHIEESETELETAIREIKEETSIDAMIIDGFKESIQYKKENSIMKHVTYFLATFQNQKMNRRWNEIDALYLLPFDEALETLTYTNSKELLIKANALLIAKGI